MEYSHRDKIETISFKAFVVDEDNSAEEGADKQKTFSRKYALCINNTRAAPDSQVMINYTSIQIIGYCT